MVGKGVPRNLAASGAALERIGIQPQRVDLRPFLKDIEHLFRAFVYEGDRADLNRDVRLSVLHTASINGGALQPSSAPHPPCPHPASKLYKTSPAQWKYM